MSLMLSIRDDGLNTAVVDAKTGDSYKRSVPANPQTIQIAWRAKS